ncbi:AN1-type zinc finger protein 1 [Ambystoma mexicanum]|uniref:AN1-type zinc finger protein 1 n=1 Tax=Ambystoma mexicanum TaxID=8296 RepID=UPI0037E9B02F
MAELDIGQHCGAEHCNQLDFLPFVCDGCSGVFCLQHRSRASHGCPGSEVSKTSIASVKSEEAVTHPCMYGSCKARELIPVLCSSCDKTFCLGHRHQSDHECEKLESPQPRMAATQQLVKDIIGSKKEATAKKGRKGSKNSETAAKVSLMKLKMHATGNAAVPQSERVYFQVFLPKEIKEKSKPMFFSSKWSLGKVVDFVASSANIKNENNRACAKKLRVCHAVSGEALPLDQTLETWISNSENPLYNGGNIILEYLDNHCELLEDVESYV